jgi:hypothetical protein
MYQETTNKLFKRKDKEAYCREHLENKGMSVKLGAWKLFLIQVKMWVQLKETMYIPAKYKVF